MHNSKLVLTLIWAFTLAGAAQAGTVTGTVTYLDRMALPPGAVLDVQLLDVSRMDVAAIQLSQMRHAIDRVPFPFALGYDDALIEDRLVYAIQARILLGDQVLYRSTQGYPVLTGGVGDRVDITVDRMPATAPDTLLPGDWSVTEIGGRPLVTDRLPTIRFEGDGSFSADSTCNRYAGRADFADGALSFPGAMAGTRMACPDPWATLERELVAALGAVTGYVATENGTMALIDAAGMAVLRLIPKP
jgi:putative lipoprotein